ncbi:MAG: rhomboid family intramembrane serine protease [Planctomycetota bacterium]
MECPYCNVNNSKSNLQQLRIGNSLVDVCPQCKGIWFDTDEMNPVIKDLEAGAKTLDIKEIMHRKAKSVNNALEHTKKCPKCAAEMRRLNYAYNSNVFIDRCDKCLGFWTDKDELTEIVRYNKGHPLLDGLGKALAEQETEMRYTRENLESIRGLMGHGRIGWAFFGPRILPLGDENPTLITPFITYAIIVLNILFFILSFGYLNSREFFSAYGLVPAHLTITAFITSMFLHGDIFHLAGNLFFFWIFGDNLEESLGAIKFVVFYLCCGIVAGFIHFLSDMNSAVPAIGASGAISGIMGGYLILYPRVRLKMLLMGRILYIPAAWYLIFWIILQVLYVSVGFGGVAWFAHIGGFVSGALVIYVLKELGVIEKK